MPSITNILRLFVALALAMISVPLLLASSANAVPDPNQVVICKYSHTPVIGELAQTVNISSTSSLDGTGFAGTFPYAFSDQHSSSVAVRFADTEENTGDLNKIINDVCPPFQAPDECEDLPGIQLPPFDCEPASETETRDLGPLLDCDAGTITTLHQERTRTEVFNEELNAFEWGPWSEWETVDQTVVDATEVDCPVDNPPIPPEPIVDPPAETPPTLPNTGSSPYLTALALMGGLLLTAGSAVFMRSRKVRVPRA